jgi:hypothetical protein
LAELEERGFGLILGYMQVLDENFDRLPFTLLWSLSPVLQPSFTECLFLTAFLLNQRTESYEWLFRTFLHAMGGKAPRLIIPDEAASMKSAIKTVFSDTIHRFCMWYIMEKVGEKVGPPTRHDKKIWTRLNACVWGSEKGDEFDVQWNAIISEFGLEENGWLDNRFEIRKSWILVFFMDVPLIGVIRTTSRSKRSNSFFNRFIHHKLSFVEFWLRFDTALECQRQEELKAYYISEHGSPLLSTWSVEKQGSIVYTHEVFKNFNAEVVAARDHCSIVGIT